MDAHNYYPSAVPSTDTSKNRLSYLLLWLNGIALIFLVMIAAARLLEWRPAQLGEYWRLVDPMNHLMLAVLVVSPFILSRGSLSAKLACLLGTVLSATLIDIDHIVAAKSFDLYAMTHLGSRPVTHSLVFALACAAIASIITRRLTIEYVVFAGLTSHIFMDASSGGTPFLFPLAGNKISLEMFWYSQLTLYAVSSIAALFKSIIQPGSIGDGIGRSRSAIKASGD
jgi:membrane-bound metal-dependent hydrolase YbcI (DUF457 family)